MADRANDDRAVCPLAVFNGAMAGMTKNGDDGDSYAVWPARLIINLHAKRLVSIVTGDTDDDESDEEDHQPSAQRLQARAAHIMTSVLGTGPFMFVQGVTNDPAAILRILDTKYQATDTLRLSCRPSTSSPPRSTGLASTWTCLSPSSKV
jgi:hypothetical protein